MAGLAVIAAFLFVLFGFMRKRRASLVTETGSYHTQVDTYNAGVPSPPTPQPLMISYATPSPVFNTTTPIHHHRLSSNISAHSDPLQGASPSSAEFLIQSTPPTNFADSSNRASNTPSSLPKDPDYDVALTNRSSSLHASGSSNILTNEQVDFVHTLYSHNIPAPAIARVMERMVGVREADASGESPVGMPGLSREDTTATKAPPKYTPQSENI